MVHCLRLRKVVQVFLVLSIFATLILSAISDEYGPPMPSDDFIENAAEEYFLELKQPKFSPEDEELYAGLVGYEIRRVHNVTQVSSPRPKVCIYNEVLFIGHWEEGSYGAEVYGDRPIGSLDRFYDSNEGDYYWKFSMVGVVASGYSNMGFKPGWFINPDWGDKVYAWWCYSKDSDGSEDDGSYDGEDGSSYDGEDSVSDDFPLEIIVGLTVLVTVIAGVGLFVISLVSGKKTGSMTKTQIHPPPPPPPFSAEAAPQVQLAEQPYSEIDPDVKRWIENIPVYPGYWYVTPDGKYVTNTINPDYTIPVEWVKGTSTEPLAELFSTPVPNMQHRVFSSRITALIKRNNPELLDKLTLGSWRKLDGDQQRSVLEKFADNLAEQVGMPQIKVELDPELDYGAAYDWNSKPPRILINPKSMNCPAEAIRVVTHEFQHYVQHTAPEKIVGGTPEYIDALKKNCDNYIHHSDDPVRYAGQLWERDAENMARIMREKINKAAYRQKLEELVEVVWGKEGLEILNKLNKTEAEKKLDKIFDTVFGKEGADILPRQHPSKKGRSR